jgi:hypothetical protein
MENSVSNKDLSMNLFNKINELLNGEPFEECVDALYMALSQAIGYGSDDDKNIIRVRLNNLMLEINWPE